MTALRALIFDVDGTLADTEQAHLVAFNHAFAQEGLAWHWDATTYTRLLEISGGKERIAHFWKLTQSHIREIDNQSRQDVIDRLHALKTAAYEQLVQGGAVQLRPGVLHLIEQAKQAGLTLAIATTTSPVNIAVLMRQAIGMDWDSHFAVVEDASTAPRKKPHSQVYLQTLNRLQLSANQVLTFEDSRNGLLAARAAAIETVITTNDFTAHHDFNGALRVLPTLAGIELRDVLDWYAQSPA